MAWGGKCDTCAYYGDEYGTGDVFIPPPANFPFYDSLARGLGLPLRQDRLKAASESLPLEILTNIQNSVKQTNEQMAELRQSMEKTGATQRTGEVSGQYRETVKMEKSGNKYGVEIALDLDTKPENLKISMKGNVLTIEVKTEKSAEDGDGSSRLYQEYVKKITLPGNVDCSRLECSLFSSRVVNIQVPFLPNSEKTKPNSTRIPVIIENDQTY